MKRKRGLCEATLTWPIIDGFAPVKCERYQHTGAHSYKNILASRGCGPIPAQTVLIRIDWTDEDRGEGA